MPAFGRDGMLKPDEIFTVADYVRSLSGIAAGRRTPISRRGKKSSPTIARPAMATTARATETRRAQPDRHRSGSMAPTKADIVETITNGGGGVMPAWVDRLDAPTIKALTVYVHTLGGGEK